MNDVYETVKDAGVFVDSYSPGDGYTRYRFFSVPADYFGGGDRGDTVNGTREEGRSDVTGGVRDGEERTIMLLYMSPQARRRLHSSMTKGELEDLAREIAVALLTGESEDAYVTVLAAIMRSREET